MYLSSTSPWVCPVDCSSSPPQIWQLNPSMMIKQPPIMTGSVSGGERSAISGYLFWLLPCKLNQYFHLNLGLSILFVVLHQPCDLHIDVYIDCVLPFTELRWLVLSRFIAITREAEMYKAEIKNSEKVR